MKHGEMDDGEERDNGCDESVRRKREKRKQTGGETSVAAQTHTHTHKYFSLFRGFNEAVRMKNDPVKSHNSTSTLANFLRRIAEETLMMSRRRGCGNIKEALWPRKTPWSLAAGQMLATGSRKDSFIGSAGPGRRRRGLAGLTRL